MGGPQESFFGTYAANDRLCTALTFDWQTWQLRRLSPSEAQPLPGMELQTTAWVGGETVALINGQRVRSGDVVAGATVVQIADGIVDMELVGRSFALRF